MSDISKSNSSSSNSSKRRISEIDDTIEHLSHEVNNLNDFAFKSEFECSLMTVKLKREKVKALAAVARSQVLLANMEVLIAECDLFSDVERLKNYKKMKLDRDEGKSQETIAKDKPASSTKSAFVQTTKTMSDKKKKKRHSSSSKKIPVDISSDETILVQTIHESTASLVEKSQSRLTFEKLKNPPANTSDSEVSLSSSIKAEFNQPYTKTQEPEKKSSIKKHKLDKKVESNKKSANVTKQIQSSTITTKSVAEINRSVNATSNCTDSHSPTASTPKNSKPNNGDRKSSACTSTYVPIRHNMPMTVTQPKNIIAPQPNTSTMSPYLYFPVTQAGVYQPPRSMNSQHFNFYGSKQFTNGSGGGL